MGARTAHGRPFHDGRLRVMRVLFVCVGNSCRSQMAEAIFNHLAEGEWEAISAGTAPETKVDPDTVRALEEIGLHPLSEPKLLTPELASQASVVVTMGCIDECPYIPGKRLIEWDIEDPKDKGIEKYRATRDEIHELVQGLIESLG